MGVSLCSGNQRIIPHGAVITNAMKNKLSLTVAGHYTKQNNIDDLINQSGNRFGIRIFPALVRPIIYSLLSHTGAVISGLFLVYIFTLEVLPLL